MKFKVTKKELNTFMLNQHTLGADTRIEFIELLKTPIILEGEPAKECISCYNKGLTCSQVHPNCDVYQPNGHKPQPIEKIVLYQESDFLENIDVVSDKINEIIKELNKK